MVAAFYLDIVSAIWGKVGSAAAALKYVIVPPTWLQASLAHPLESDAEAVSIRKHFRELRKKQHWFPVYLDRDTAILEPAR
jgi:hypothetical protein